MPVVGPIHATALAIPPVRDAFARLRPPARPIDLLDEGPLAVLEAEGSIGPPATARVLQTPPPELAARRLSSPTLAVESSRRALDGR